MDTCLYLDTARLGPMCRQAQAADRDFARLAGEEAGSVYFEQFFKWGFTCLPRSMARRFPGLSSWSGIDGFKRDLTGVLAVPPDTRILIANRSAELVRLAARALFSRCQRVMTTDMLWPAYRRILLGEAIRCHGEIATVPAEQAILRDGMPADELARYLAGQYAKCHCDGLFLSAVTFHGIRLPIQDLVAQLAGHSTPRFVVVDGAQAVNHVPLAMAADYCDLLLTGCHKWLRAYHPLGLAFCPRDSSRRVISDTCRAMYASEDLDDPLLRFLHELDDRNADRFSETVNLAPLITAGAAVREVFGSRLSRRDELESKIHDTNCASEEAARSSWRPIRPAESLRSGIVLLEATRRETRSAAVDVLREQFRRVGITLTAYTGGVLRASFPAERLTGSGWRLFRRSLAKLA